VDQPSALHLAAAAAFAPLSDQDFVSTLVFNGETSIVIDFMPSAPVDLSIRISQGLSGDLVTLTESGIEIDISTWKSRAELRAAGLDLARILEAAGSTTTQISEAAEVSVKKLDHRDREFLDNVPPHHGV
jgi:hypothetical protein